MPASLLLLIRRGLLLLALLNASKSAWAQSPAIDPTFQPTAVYKPAWVEQAVQQPDGKRLVLSSGTGASTRAGQLPAGPVVRFLANSNAPDAAFTNNVRPLQGAVGFVVALATGKVLLVGAGPLTLGSVTRQRLLLLQPDGTPDAGFDAGPFTGLVTHVAEQSDGKLVLACRTASASGGGLLLRLLPNGALDTAFQAALSTSLPSISRVGGNVALQPDGKLLVPGTFGTRGLVRLLPDGALDAAFNAQLATSATLLAHQVAVQPDGKVLVTTFDRATGGLVPLVRLTDAGALDPGFQPAVTHSFMAPFSTAHEQQVQVQADGKLLVQAPSWAAGGAFLGGLVRLLPDGRLDPAFVTTASLGTAALNGAQLLPNGQVLAVKAVGRSAGTPLHWPVLLHANGGPDASFVPPLYTPGQVNDVVPLAGGGYLVGGNFTEINGLAAGHLARLSATGVPDPSFLGHADGEVRTVWEQPDGKLVVGGSFERVNGTGRVALARLLPSGAVDAAFAPPFQPNSRPGSGVGRVAVLPDGRVLAAGLTQLPGATAPEPWLRFLDAATGQPDASAPRYEAQDLVVQPNGKVVVAGFVAAGSSAGLGHCLFRLLPSNALDPTFAPYFSFRSALGGGPVVTALAQDAAGHLYFTAHSYTDTTPFLYGGALYHLLPDGAPTGSEQNTHFISARSLAVQPNGRVLVGADANYFVSFPGGVPTGGLSRHLTSLAPDPGFLPANGPGLGVHRLLVQPDGAILAAGQFTRVGGQPIGGLVRLHAAQVLSVATHPLAGRTQAWPVPAHDRLHLRLDAGAGPRQVELLDALGRAVLTQAVTQPELTLDTAPLAAGVYVLRVQYARGPVTRRVAVE